MEPALDCVLLQAWGWVLQPNMEHTSQPMVVPAAGISPHIGQIQTLTIAVQGHHRRQQGPRHTIPTRRKGRQGSTSTAITEDEGRQLSLPCTWISCSELETSLLQSIAAVTLVELEVVLQVACTTTGAVQDTKPGHEMWNTPPTSQYTRDLHHQEHATLNGLRTLRMELDLAARCEA